MTEDRSTRALAAAAYALMLGAAVILGPSVLLEQLGPVWAALCGFLGLGGLLAAVGQLRGRLTGELLGLPLLVSAFAAFGALTALTAWSTAPAYALGNGALLASVACLLHTRWRMVRRQLPRRSRP